jgi:septal ring factor EnvC (AmiA/AmiB activator)
LKQEKEHLESEVAAREEKVASLEKQIMQDKNETKVLSQKKCRGCENL